MRAIPPAVLALALGTSACAPPAAGPPALEPAPALQRPVTSLGGAALTTPLVSRLARMFSARVPGRPITVEPPLGETGGLRALRAGRLSAALLSVVEGDAVPAGARLIAWTRPCLVVGSGAGRRRVEGRRLGDVLDGRPLRWSSGLAMRFVLRPAGDPLQRAFVAGRPDLARAFQRVTAAGRWQSVRREDELIAALGRTPGAMGLTDMGGLSLRGPPLWRVDVPGPPPARVGLYVLAGRAAGPRVAAFLGFLTGDEAGLLVSSLGFEAP